MREAGEVEGDEDEGEGDEGEGDGDGGDDVGGAGGAGAQTSKSGRMLHPVWLSSRAMSVSACSRAWSSLTVE